MKEFIKRLTVDKNFKAGAAILAVLVFLGSGYNLYQVGLSGSGAAGTKSSESGEAKQTANKCPTDKFNLCVNLSRQCGTDQADCRKYCTPENGCTREELRQCLQDSRDKYNRLILRSDCSVCLVYPC